MDQVEEALVPYSWRKLGISRFVYETLEQNSRDKMELAGAPDK